MASSGDLLHLFNNPCWLFTLSLGPSHDAYLTTTAATTLSMGHEECSGQDAGPTVAIYCLSSLCGQSF